MLGLFLSLCLLLGASYYVYDSWKFLFHNKFQIACFIVAACGYWVLLYACLKHLYRALDADHKKEAHNVSTLSGLCNKVIDWFFRHPFLAPVLCIGSTWSVVFLIFFPGSVTWDGLWQLNQYFQVPMPESGSPIYFEPSNHQPYFATCIIGFVMQIGRLVGSDTGGVFLVVFIQITLCLSVYASVVAHEIKLGMPRSIAVGTTAFFALCPIWASYAQAVGKDALFAAFFCLFTLSLFDVALNRKAPERIDRRTWILLAISTLMVCLFRNNGLWAVLPTLIVACIALRTVRVSLLISMGSSTLLACVLMFVALPAMGIPKGSSAEALSIPFQQTARYLLEYPEDVTDKQMAVIDALFSGNDLASLYNPELSDPVKGTLKQDASIDEFASYGTVWFEMLLKHPDSYLQATLNNTYGYFYPSGVFDDHVDTYFFATNTSPVINTGFFDFEYVFDSGEHVRNVVSDASYLLERIPLLGIVVSCATYVWAFIIVFGYAVSRKKKVALYLCIPSLITLLICLASPVNACIRYFLPVMATLPVIIMACTLHKSRTLSEPIDDHESNRNANHASDRKVAARHRRKLGSTNRFNNLLKRTKTILEEKGGNRRGSEFQ
ncbi:DUF6020 family protein [Raoultibacter phocaeensis]|uniref:DUF6020 family protein n=1 Tax=Raoultibacter phocaeensis TaxID=2479841 RepID=UPI0011188E93|nr:DUF6020 family protein [Raoultibacter phocaeensis]